MNSDSFQRKIATFFAWINFLFSFLFIASFILIVIFAYSSVEAKTADKAYAIALLVGFTFFPAIFLFLNGLILKSKCSGKEKKEEFKDF